MGATVPGMGRTAAPEDVTIENHAGLAGKLAADGQMMKASANLLGNGVLGLILFRLGMMLGAAF